MNESDLRGVKALVNDIEVKLATAKGLINQAIEAISKDSFTEEENPLAKLEEALSILEEVSDYKGGIRL